MRPQVYVYEDPNKQTVCFRGYTKDYSQSPNITIHTCKQVRSNKKAALKDAEALIKQIRLSYGKTNNS